MSRWLSRVAELNKRHQPAHDIVEKVRAEMGWNTTAMPKEFRDPDAVAMKEVEKAIIEAVLPFRERSVPAWLVAIALMRCTRTVFRLVRKNDQKELKPVMLAFFEGKVNPPGESGLLWTPDQVM